MSSDMVKAEFSFFFSCCSSPTLVPHSTLLRPIFSPSCNSACTWNPSKQSASVRCPHWPWMAWIARSGRTACSCHLLWLNNIVPTWAWGTPLTHPVVCEPGSSCVLLPTLVTLSNHSLGAKVKGTDLSLCCCPGIIRWRSLRFLRSLGWIWWNLGGVTVNTGITPVIHYLMLPGAHPTLPHPKGSESMGTCAQLKEQTESWLSDDTKNTTNPGFWHTGSDGESRGERAD